MVKFWGKYENQIALTVGFILVALIAFGGGILYEEEKSHSQEPLQVVSFDTVATSLALTITQIEGDKVYAHTDPKATVKIGESTILAADTQGNFSFALAAGVPLLVYDAEHIITLDLSKINFFAPGSSTQKENSADNVSAGQDNLGPVNPVTTSSPPQDKVTTPKAEIPITGQFVGSRNSDKYHLPDCRWAKRIKLENQVWFSSQEEAQSRGYAPCAQCIK